MAQVSNQSELQAALEAQASPIQVASGFNISSQITIQYDVTIESISSTDPMILTKDASYFTYMFRILNGGSLTLRNIILDGDEKSHPEEHTDNRSLVYVTGGTLHLLDGASLRGNRSYLEGGGVYLNNTSSYSNTFIMSGNSSITECSSRTNGGGLMIASGNPQDSFSITDHAMIDSNTADNGGSLYARTYASEVGLSLLIGDYVEIINNSAAKTGGGIAFSGYRNGQGAPSTLNISGEVLVSANQAADGGGIYFNSDNGAVLLTGDVKISQNRADGIVTEFGGHGGGICLIPGVLTIYDMVEISHNHARRYGGGVSAAEDSRITMDGGTLTDNTSGEYGGAIWNLGNSTVTLTGGSLSGNRAPYGGSLYNDSLFYANGERDLSDGVYLDNPTAVVHLTGPFADSSVIQLETSRYVTPDPDGTPIIVGTVSGQYTELAQSDADAFRKPATGFEGREIRLSSDRTQVLLAPEVYEIHFENLLGAAHSNPLAYTCYSPDIELLPPDPVAGCHFIGWFETPSGGNRITSIPQGSHGDLTLYARWEISTD